MTPLEKHHLHRMLRVNQAGEHGAVRIYAGQKAVLGDSSIGAELDHMAIQEQEHKQLFDSLLVHHKIRPTVLSPIWHGAGYALGFATALMGKKAAMACTVAVEEVIEKHYQDQLDTLQKTPNIPEEIVSTIRKCQAEEIEHKDLAIEQEAKSFKGYKPLSFAIKTGAKAAIWLSERF
ncbi:MAG: demethoxyubiquinone hydroxylase family protein [Rickettsiales bacterium]|nr:demethoxyubiquinone hydroxylase family protein [Rickettsiales bacterium]|tara:strand:- start:3824 stop:4354 length:531 start_codon:yes stop_codon:yes gene_type:complete